ncbi:hypothetical protein ACJZ2D_014049 [Fusarium nematophilum]
MDTGNRPSWLENELALTSRLRTVGDWILGCSKNHERCIEAISTWPRRLLDLSTIDSLQKARLLESSTIREETIHYATLNNQEEHSRGIHLDQLTRNFHDAVWVCGKLGLRYLWIDSLCIIQNPKIDWEAKAAKMADIYRGSYLNIAAAAAQDAHGGRQSTTDLDTKVSKESIAILLDLGAQDYQQFSSSLYPYFERGWVLQELTLSPRTAFFTKGQLFWQCRHRFGSEDGTLWKDQFLGLASGKHPSGVDFDFSSMFGGRLIWNLWVNSYSKRRLSYAPDVGPAIADLVGFFSKMMGYKPMLGLWDQSLSFDLDWTLRETVVDPAEFTTCPEASSDGTTKVDSRPLDSIISPTKLRPAAAQGITSSHKEGQISKSTSETLKLEPVVARHANDQPTVKCGPSIGNEGRNSGPGQGFAAAVSKLPSRAQGSTGTAATRTYTPHLGSIDEVPGSPLTAAVDQKAEESLGHSPQPPSRKGADPGHLCVEGIGA